MLVLLIPGKESVTSENIDVYLAPLIEELQQLWHGVKMLSMSQMTMKTKKMSSKQF
jgi:hypothetical protein